MTKPKLLFVYDNAIEPMDGLHAAISALEDDFEVTKLNLHNDQDTIERYEFCLGHGAFGSSVDKYVPYSNANKKGLCVGGNALPPNGADNYDVLFAETDWIINNYLPKHKNIVKAFGCNVDIFSPIDMPTPIIWDYIGVGAFASWKRWEKMKEKKGSRLVIGEYQLGNEQESLSIARDLLVNGVMVSNIVNPLELSLMYQYSRTLYMPSTEHGGGERSVIEARSCGLTVEIEPDNLKLKELVEMETIPSHHDYAKALRSAILEII